VGGGTQDMGFIGALPTSLFPVWGVALAVATLAYYYRRRGVCETCGRGSTAALEEAGQQVHDGYAAGGQPSTSVGTR
jgi:hypothetical protein